MTARRYPSPEAFKQALEQRLRAATKTGAAFARRRQLLVFDRFLARIVQVLGDTATLKGGLVLELRLDRARTTKDIDLRLTGKPRQQIISTDGRPMSQRQRARPIVSRAVDLQYAATYVQIRAGHRRTINGLAAPVREFPGRDLCQRSLPGSGKSTWERYRRAVHQAGRLRVGLRGRRSRAR